MATAALMDAIVVTSDVSDFETLAGYFSGVPLLSAK
jgi:predicted nucleic acid-binding protein